jgi:hypothetical protein
MQTFAVHRVVIFAIMWLRLLKVFKRFVIVALGFFIALTLAMLVFRKKIEHFAIRQLDPYLKVPVYIHDVEFTFWKTFPNFSLRLHGVLIKDYDHKTAISGDTLLYAKTIDLKANTWSLLKADFSIQSFEMEGARVGLRVDKNGYKNYDVFVQDSTVKENQSFEVNLKRVNFSEVNFSFKHIPNEQEYTAYFDKLLLSGTFNAQSFQMHMASQFTINRFQDKSLTLLRKVPMNFETDVSVDNRAKRYEIPNAFAEINKIPFNLRFLQDSNSLEIHLDANKIPLALIMESVHQKDLNKFKEMTVRGEADVALEIIGSPQINESPNITANFTLRQGSLDDRKKNLKVQKLNLTGRYQKLRDKPELLELNKFDITTMGQALTGQLSLIDFAKPQIKTTAKGTIDLRALHYFFPLPKVEQISGQLWINGTLHAVLRNPGMNDQELLLTDSQTDLDCRDIQLKLQAAFPEIKEINGKISTRNDDFVFNRFRVVTAGSRVEISGTMDNLIPYFEREEALNFKAAIRADRIDLNEFISTESAASNSSATNNFGVYLLPKNVFGQIEYDIAQIIVGEHDFFKLMGVTNLTNREIDFRKIQLEHLGSFIQGDFNIQERIAGTLNLQGDVSSKNIDLKMLFHEWNNFEQENIKAENIAGKAESRLKFQMPYNLVKGPIKDQLNAQVSLKVVGGSLTQLEALKEVAKSMKNNDLVRVFLGKNLRSIEQKLEKLTFDNLENTFYISQSKFVIPKMTIRTNVMNLVVSGWQHFDESLEYHFEFDFKDLKQQNRDAQFGDINQDGFAARLFLKMFGTLSKLQFAWDGAAKKAHKQEQLKQQKQDVKGMLKAEFGLFNKDSTVQSYKSVSRPKETISIDFGADTIPAPNVEKKKREINQKFNQIRKENQTKAEKVIIEFE